LELSGCAAGGAADPDDEWEMSGTRTQVWTTRNRWEDTDTPTARAAGPAWPADSGLARDARFTRWSASTAWSPSVDLTGGSAPRPAGGAVGIPTPRLASLDGDETTVELTTPWGKTLPSPMLECAETSLFLRITFAAWYELPLVLETQDGRGRRVYFGRNGVRAAAGRYAQSPELAIAYRDDSGSSGWRTHWPSDPVLRCKRIAGGDDDQVELADGARFGAYLDEIHLHKRVGHFTVMVLDYLGSANLADPANAYNLAPNAVRPGDFLLERWQADPRPGLARAAGHRAARADQRRSAGSARFPPATGRRRSAPSRSATAGRSSRRRAR
jgi:hypothetical protein